MEVFPKEFKIESIKYKITMEDNAILLTRRRYTFSFLLFITGTLSICTVFAFINSHFKTSHLIFYILTIPYLIGFIKEITLFIKKTVMRIDADHKVIFKNDKVFIRFNEIKRISLSTIKSEDGHLDSYSLEMVLLERQSFEIGETSDIRIYDLGQRISKLTGSKLEYC